jgi:thiol-disulfide isomerase/thioredoxin
MILARRPLHPFQAALLLAPAVLLLAAATPAAGPGGEELAIGSKGPSFSLKGTDGKSHALEADRGIKGTAVIFTCNTCPFSQGYEARLIALARDYQPKGVAFIAVNANDPKVAPGDSFDKMVERAREKAYPFPYLQDETQATAAAYGAKVTPHIFLLDAQGVLVYRGRVDDSLEEGKVTKREFTDALAALAAGKPVPVAETKAFGCGVKWSKKAA